mmetsp:Transcript_19460/g.46017  ORF Transcript_19460/g.46017 Transcript_19460/m.46017 type:complete len:133 (-) Transcript_19460:272-670(-)
MLPFESRVLLAQTVDGRTLFEKLVSHICRVSSENMQVCLQSVKLLLSAMNLCQSLLRPLFCFCSGKSMVEGIDTGKLLALLCTKELYLCATLLLTQLSAHLLKFQTTILVLPGFGLLLMQFPIDIFQLSCQT